MGRHDKKGHSHQSRKDVSASHRERQRAEVEVQEASAEATDHSQYFLPQTTYQGPSESTLPARTGEYNPSQGAVPPTHIAFCFQEIPTDSSSKQQTEQPTKHQPSLVSAYHEIGSGTSTTPDANVLFQPTSRNDPGNLSTLVPEFELTAAGVPIQTGDSDHELFITSNYYYHQTVKSNAASASSQPYSSPSAAHSGAGYHAAMTQLTGQEWSHKDLQSYHGSSASQCQKKSKKKSVYGLDELKERMKNKGKDKGKDKSHR